MPVRLDVRGGLCGASDGENPCLAPIAFGQCPRHGRRHGLIQRISVAPKRPMSTVTHPPGWVDGRTRAGRAAKAARLVDVRD